MQDDSIARSAGRSFSSEDRLHQPGYTNLEKESMCSRSRMHVKKSTLLARSSVTTILYAGCWFSGRVRQQGSAFPEGPSA